MLFSKEIWQALALYREKHKGKYYQLLYKGIKFSHYVGILQIGRLTIEILPKIDRLEQAGATNWQQVLIDMLQHCNLLKVASFGYGNVQLKSNTLLDLYIAQFLNATQKYVQTGLIKKYLPQESNAKYLKGQLLLSKHLRHNAINLERFYIRTHVLQAEHLMNQILFEALKALKQLHLNPILQAKLDALFPHFPKFKPYKWTAKDFVHLLNNRAYQAHRTLIELARLVLMNCSTDIRYGQHALMALLFDMNVLFEEYIYQQLKRRSGETMKVTRQTSIPFWQRRMIRPDIVVQIAGERIVLDTKWKVVPNKKPAIEDLKQMYIYCRYFKAKKGILIYPWAGISTIPKSQPFLDEANSIYCQLQFLNVLDESGQLKNNLGEEILSGIKHSQA